MLTDRNRVIRDLRRLVRDEAENPLKRLDAAEKLITKFGASERNSAALRVRVKALMRSPDEAVSARAHEIRDLLVLRLEKKPALRTIQTLTTNLSDDADDDATRHTPKPSRSYSRTRLVIAQPPADGYVRGTLDLEPFVTRLKGFKATTSRTEDWTAQVRAALGIAETDPIDAALVAQLWLATFHEPELDGMGSLGAAITGYAHAQNLSLPRPTGISLMQELERRS
jgi:hypothetical protein